MKKILAILTLFVLFVSCESEIQNLKIENPSESIVVYGELTNGVGPYTVTINRVNAYSPYDVSEFSGKPIKNAEVKIIDGSGKIQTLKEKRAGVYETDTLFRGVVNQTYKLAIKTQDGLVVESSVEKITKSPVLDEFSYNFVDAEKVEDMRFNLKATIKDPSETTDYYYIKRQDFIQFLTTCPEPPPPPAPVPVCYSKCWRAPLNTQPMFVEDFLVNGKNIPLTLKAVEATDYTDWVVQLNVYSVSKALSDFWKRQEEQRTIGGGLFDKIPAQILGNLQCINKPELQVLGVFMVGGVTKKRLTIGRFQSFSLENYKKVAFYTDFHDVRFKNLKLWDCNCAAFVDYNIGYYLPPMF